MSQLIQDCKDLILKKSASVRTLSQIIAKLTSTMQAGEELVRGEGVQLCCASKQRIPERTPVVDRPAVDLEWEVVNLPSP